MRDNYKSIGELNLPRNKKYIQSQENVLRIKHDLICFDASNKLTIDDIHIVFTNVTYVEEKHFKAIN